MLVLPVLFDGEFKQSLLLPPLLSAVRRLGRLNPKGRAATRSARSNVAAGTCPFPDLKSI